ncbi:MAG TPA: M20/M25/M40 family metallo-hydrolase [Candidatus Avoscillospira avistercoris]|uniref:M20/M25/M40 family metallo-hydrolase n=1 Tax=Candidatus Avoscillospira avistercoris TaxID=2840707 RepID=A0A9D1FAX0_9FIRM|nr:M20/M25/M40 family metallo-hydrolase [Candidatus Avoscillospira avistercoris]
MDAHIKAIAEQYAAETQEEALELLRTLGKIPAPSRQEDLRATFCRDWLLSQGASDVTIDKLKNVICKINCTEERELVVFAAHTDVVFPDTDELPMHEADGKLYAPGIGDDTSNLVNLLMAAKYLLKNRLSTKYGILIVANSCEEGLGNLDGVKELFATYGTRIKAFYSFDGYTPQCCSNGVGSYRYRITCRTTGGHSYLNFGEPNAIQILCGLVEDLYKIQAPTEEKTTYNVGRIEGGTTVNSIAQSCSMLYEFRSTSQKCLETMEKALHEVVEAHRGRGGELEVELLGVRPGNGPLDRKALAAFTEQTADIISNFYTGDIDYAAYSTDSNVPLSLGILANTVGTVLGGLAHTREEWVWLDSLPKGLGIALSLMLLYVDHLD